MAKSDRKSLGYAAFGVPVSMRIIRLRRLLPVFWDGDVKGAGEHLLCAEDDGMYRDVHGWYFTQSSFRLLMLELARIGLLDFHEVDVFSAKHCEFFYHFGPRAAASHRRRVS
jgi:hypothetical protein